MFPARGVRDPLNVCAAPNRRLLPSRPATLMQSFAQDHDALRAFVCGCARSAGTGRRASDDFVRSDPEGPFPAGESEGRSSAGPNWLFPSACSRFTAGVGWRGGRAGSTSPGEVGPPSMRIEPAAGHRLREICVSTAAAMRLRQALILLFLSDCFVIAVRVFDERTGHTPHQGGGFLLAPTSQCLRPHLRYSGVRIQLRSLVRSSEGVPAEYIGRVLHTY